MSDRDALSLPTRFSRLRDGESWQRQLFVLLHPLSACLAVALLLTCHALLGGWGMVAAFVLQAVFVVMVARTEPIRRATLRHHRARRHRDARYARALLKERMEPDDVMEYEEIVNRVDAARARIANLGEDMEIMFDECCEPDRLLTAYLRLSVAHRALRESAWRSNRLALCRSIAHADREIEEASNERLRKLAEQRASLLRRRLECLERSEQERAVLRSQAATLAELCRLTHERVCNAVHPWQLTSRVEEIVSEIELHEEVLTALDGGLDVDERDPFRVRVDESELEDLVDERELDAAPAVLAAAPRA